MPGNGHQRHAGQRGGLVAGHDGQLDDFVQKTSGTTDLNQDRAHNAANELTGITETVGTAWVDLVHDRAGNVTTMPKPSSLPTGLTCTWDAWNRLVAVKQGAVVMGAANTTRSVGG